MLTYQQKGGIATGLIKRKKALEAYYENPKICLYCDSVIKVAEKQTVREVKKKKFCNRSCAAKYNNSLYPKRSKKEKVKKPEKENLYETLTKGELYSRRKNWQSANSSIRKYARLSYEKSKKPKKCKICGYNKHVDICHIKNVSEFEKNCKLSEINNITNLVALCKNHHWEFDNGFIKLDAE